MVAQYTRPDQTTQNGSPYRSNIDGGIVASERIALAFLPQAQAVANMTVRVLAGALVIGGALTEIAAQSTPTLVAPVTNPRIDRVVMNQATGAILVVSGAEAASPVAPTIPSGYSPICRVQLATSTTAIGASLITDERVAASSASTAASSAASFDDATAARLALAWNNRHIPLFTLAT